MVVTIDVIPITMPAITGVKKSLAMGCLLLPVILFFKTVLRYREAIMPYIILLASYAFSEVVFRRRFPEARK